MTTTEIVIAMIAVARIFCHENEDAATAEAKGPSMSHIAAQSPSDTSEATTNMARGDRNAPSADSSECDGPPSNICMKESYAMKAKC
jgi:hypothetical protein